MVAALKDIWWFLSYEAPRLLKQGHSLGCVWAVAWSGECKHDRGRGYALMAEKPKPVSQDEFVLRLLPDEFRALRGLLEIHMDEAPEQHHEALERVLHKSRRLFVEALGTGGA